MNYVVVPRGGGGNSNPSDMGQRRVLPYYKGYFTRKIRFQLLMAVSHNKLFFLSYFFTKLIKVISPMYFINYWYSREAEDQWLLSWYKSFDVLSLRDGWWWWLSDVADPLHIFSRHAYTHTGSGHGFRVNANLILNDMKMSDGSKDPWILKTQPDSW